METPKARNSKAPEKRNDTRAAWGLSQDEVLALHGELRALVDIHKAPSPREMEIWQALVRPQLGSWPYDSWQEGKGSPRYAVKVEGGKVQLSGMPLWGAGGDCMGSAVNLHRFGDRFHLDMCVQYSDAMLDQLNDPVTGYMVPEDGVRPPLFVRTRPRQLPGESKEDYDRLVGEAKRAPDSETARELAARPKVGRYEWLFNGNVARGIVTTANWVLDHPEVHDLPAPQIPGQSMRTGRTYLEKTRYWLGKLKPIFDHIEKYRKFDDRQGVWVLPANRQSDPSRVEYRTLPVNRFMIFNQAYLLTGIALRKLDPEANGPWYERARYVARRGFDFWRTCLNGTYAHPPSYPRENAHGPIYVWGYSKDGSSSEDQAHLGMDIRPMIAINRYEPELSADDWKAVANMAFCGLYNYDTHTVNKGVFRHPQPRGSAVFRVYCPPFGRLIGKYMPDAAYETFMNEQLFLWDERLEKGLLGRIDTYRMHFELLEARLNRFGRDPWLTLPDAR